MKAAILVICGFTQPDYRNEGCGLWRLLDEIEHAFPNRRDVWLRMRRWNGPVDHDAAELAGRMDAQKQNFPIYTVSYSWGNGLGLHKFGKSLARFGREIDMACCIDPVPYTTARWISRAMFPGNGKFELPDNVKSFASWRTVNKTSVKQPWARDIETKGHLVFDRTAFGSQEKLTKYKPAGTHIVDASVNHSNIEDDPRVHDGVMGVLTALLGRA
jgi:hypothetical protein